MGRSIAPEREPLPPDEEGYCYTNEQHFDETMTRVARDQLANGANELESRIIPLAICFSVLGAAAACAGVGVGAAVAILGAASAGFFVYITREARQARRVERERLCFRCSYSLLNLPVDERGSGACPECGTNYQEAFYRRPPPLYIRGDS